MREPDECDGLGGTCGLARGHEEPCRTCFVEPPLAALKGATERIERAAASCDCAARRCSPATCLCTCHPSSVPPTPAEMLGEALVGIPDTALGEMFAAASGVFGLGTWWSSMPDGMRDLYAKAGRAMRDSLLEHITREAKHGR